VIIFPLHEFSNHSAMPKPNFTVELARSQRIFTSQAALIWSIGTSFLLTDVSMQLLPLFIYPFASASSLTS
jgi:hypothetical protein